VLDSDPMASERDLDVYTRTSPGAYTMEGICSR
jgi:hypothetical protein